MASENLESKYVKPEEFIAILRQRFGHSWAGFPLPAPGFSMTVDERYPFAEVFEQEFPDDFKIAEEEPQGEAIEGEEINTWWRPGKPGKHVGIVRQDDGSFRGWQSWPFSPVERIVKTFFACRSWNVSAEMRAMKKLRRHVTREQWNCYVLTGAFLEVSKRSQLVYIFRRLRPTIVVSERGGCIGILCSHPIGYYDDAWAGAMVPTDDLLSHLLLMRADEHYFWRISNQHRPDDLGVFA